MDRTARVVVLAFAMGVQAMPADAAGPDATGSLLIKPSGDAREGDASLLDLASGQRRALPASEWSRKPRGGADRWSANSQVLVRVDGAQNVDVFERRSGRRVGGFSLERLPGVNQPQWWGPVKPSPDGRLLLAYWKKDYRQQQPELAVFERDGRVVETGSPYRYDTQGHNEAFDWLPDGDFVYLAGPKIVVRRIGSPSNGVAPLPLPPEVRSAGSLAASPDGQRLLLGLPTTLRSRTGREATFGLLYVANLDGTGLRQLTVPSERSLSDGDGMLHRRATWSPDGRQVAFAADPGRHVAIPYFSNGCPPIAVVPASAERVPVDGLRDADEWHLLPRGRNAGPLLACLPATLQWLR